MGPGFSTLRFVPLAPTLEDCLTFEMNASSHSIRRNAEAGQIIHARCLLSPKVTSTVATETEVSAPAAAASSARALKSWSLPHPSVHIPGASLGSRRGSLWLCNLRFSANGLSRRSGAQVVYLRIHSYTCVYIHIFACIRMYMCKQHMICMRIICVYTLCIQFVVPYLLMYLSTYRLMGGFRLFKMRPELDMHGVSVVT